MAADVSFSVELNTGGDPRLDHECVFLHFDDTRVLVADSVGQFFAEFMPHMYKIHQEILDGHPECRVTIGGAFPDDSEERAREQQAIDQFLAKPYPVMTACGCSGPIDGQPECPCAMKWCVLLDGHYYKINESRSREGIFYSACRLIEPIPSREEIEAGEVKKNNLAARLARYKQQKQQNEIS